MRPRMRESLEVIKKLTEAREPISYEGEFWSGQDRAIQVPRIRTAMPEMALAGLTGTSSYEIAGANGWAALSVHFTPPQFDNNPSFSDLVAQAAAIEQAQGAAGLDPTRGAAAAGGWSARSTSPPTGRPRCARFVRRQTVLRLPDRARPRAADEARRDDGRRRAEPRVDGRERPLAGRLAGRVRGDGQAASTKDLGGFGTLIVNSRDWVTTDLTTRSWEMFARYCIPALEGLEIGRRDTCHRWRNAPGAARRSSSSAAVVPSAVANRELGEPPGQQHRLVGEALRRDLRRRAGARASAAGPASPPAGRAGRRGSSGSRSRRRRCGCPRARVELVGALEAARVAVGRALHEQDLGAGSIVVPAQLDRLAARRARPSSPGRRSG